MGRKRGTKRKASTSRSVARRPPAQPNPESNAEINTAVSSIIRQTRSQAQAIARLENNQVSGPTEPLHTLRNAFGQTTGCRQKNIRTATQSRPVRDVNESSQHQNQNDDNDDAISVNVTNEDRRDLGEETEGEEDDENQANVNNGDRETATFTRKDAMYTTGGFGSVQNSATQHAQHARQQQQPNPPNQRPPVHVQQPPRSTVSVPSVARAPDVRSVVQIPSRQPSQNGENINSFNYTYPSLEPEQTLTSICNPLGDDIPMNIKDKIIKGDFVEFGLLLDNTPDNLNSHDNVSFGLNTEGQLIINQPKNQRNIMSIHAWTSAFLVFTAIYLRAHPQRAQELLKYGNIVRTAAEKFQGWGWRTYDRQFRLRQKSHPENPWHVIDGELWTLYVAVPSAFSSIAVGAVSQNNFRGSSKKSQSRSTRGSYPGGAQRGGSQATQRSSTKFCFNYNNRGSCPRQNCQYSHSCRLCKQEGHGAKTCTNVHGPR